MEKLYTKYENELPHLTKMKARTLMSKIIEAQIETGLLICFTKMLSNEKSNQKNLGVIKSSNLCAEIVEYSAPDEVAVCNLASIALPKFVKEDKSFDYQNLYETAKLATKNLDRVIDINYYPTEKTGRSNSLHRPIGLGIQGLADVFFLMGIPHDGEKAKEINIKIFETIYFGSVESSWNSQKKKTCQE